MINNEFRSNARAGRRITVGAPMKATISADLGISPAMVSRNAAAARTSTPASRNDYGAGL